MAATVPDISKRKRNAKNGVKDSVCLEHEDGDRSVSAEAKMLDPRMPELKEAAASKMTRTKKAPASRMSGTKPDPTKRQKTVPCLNLEERREFAVQRCPPTRRPQTKASLEPR